MQEINYDEIVPAYAQGMREKTSNDESPGCLDDDHESSLTSVVITEDDLERLSWYNMNHRKRGVALIFNHKNFERKELIPRHFAEEDGKKLSETLKFLGFDVRYYLDLTVQKIEEKLSEVAKENHDDCDCLLIAILTYDDRGGSLHAFDKTYKEAKVWSYFVTEKVKSLGGKPKIFLFQASRVQRSQKKDTVIDSMDSPNLRSLVIPSHADFLKVYSSAEGRNSSSDGKSDSSFLQHLCMELQEYASKADFVSILTKTLNEVKARYLSASTGPRPARKKEMPIVTSTLTRRLVLKPKLQIPSDEPMES